MAAKKKVKKKKLSEMRKRSIGPSPRTGKEISKDKSLSPAERKAQQLESSARGLEDTQKKMSGNKRGAKSGLSKKAVAMRTEAGKIRAEERKKAAAKKKRKK